MRAWQSIRTHSLFSKSPLSNDRGEFSIRCRCPWIVGDSEMIALSSTLGTEKRVFYDQVTGVKVCFWFFLSQGFAFTLVGVATHVVSAGFLFALLVSSLRARGSASSVCALSRARPVKNCVPLDKDLHGGRQSRNVSRAGEMCINWGEVCEVKKSRFRLRNVTLCELPTIAGLEQT